MQRFARTEPVDDQPVVADAVTDLVWQGCVAGLTGRGCDSGSVSLMNWQEILSYCENLDWGGHTDWYLPNVIELNSIVDDNHREPTVDPEAFPAMPDLWLSSSSSCYACGILRAWDVHPYRGYVNGADIKTRAFSAALCVRRD